MAAKSKTQSETAEESVAADIVNEDAPAIKPPNSPSLKPWAALTRRQRADYQKTWAQNLPAEALSEIEDDEGLDIGRIGLGFVFSFLADVEDALALVAVAPAQFRTWAANVDDDELQDLFAWYQEQHASGK